MRHQTTVEIERPLPQNLEAERSILGAILLDNCTFAAVKMLPAEDFSLREHRLIFQCMIDMANKEQPIDLVTLIDTLRNRGELPEVGGDAYISRLPDGRPRLTNVAFYTEIVASYAHRRRVIHFANNLYESGFDDAQHICDLLGEAATQIAQLRDRTQLTAARSWRKKFHTVGELPEGNTIFPIDRILPEGITFLGSLSGVGKTWFALSMARALTKGEKFLGVWEVPEPVDILYLCPEMSAKTFRMRCQRFGISERFHCQTIADGAPLDLADPLLVAAIRELRPVVFLDTAIRFSNAEDENSAADNQELAGAIFSLIYAGARAVVCLHHRAKATARMEEMTLENTLRGTGDLGAVAAAVYGLRYDQLAGGNAPYLKESRRLVRLQIQCVKARDFVAVEEFRVQLDPYIDTINDMALLTDKIEDLHETEIEKVDSAICGDREASLRKIAKLAGVSKDRVKKLASERGWYRGTAGWARRNAQSANVSASGVCPAFPPSTGSQTDSKNYTVSVATKSQTGIRQTSGDHQAS